MNENMNSVDDSNIVPDLLASDPTRRWPSRPPAGSPEELGIDRPGRLDSNFARSSISIKPGSIRYDTGRLATLDRAIWAYEVSVSKLTKLSTPL